MDSELVSKIVFRLFPTETKLTWNSDEVPLDERFWVVPGKAGPRWIIPQNPQYGWPVLNKWRPYEISSRLKWSAITAAYRVGRLGLLPGVIGMGVAGSSNASWQHLGWQGKESPVPVVYVGTPGSTRKAVVTLVDRGERKAASIVKIPLGPRAAESILHEADILEQLALEFPGLAPSILYVDREKGAASQEVVDGQPTGRKITEAHIEWLVGLKIDGEETSLLEQADGLDLRLKALTGIDRQTRSLLSGLFDSIKDPTKLPAVWVHGDFAPWNWRWTDAKKLSVIDWEDAERFSLPFYDFFHCNHVQNFLFREQRRTMFSESMTNVGQSYMRSMEIPESLVSKLEIFYLIDRFARRTIEAFQDQYTKYLLDFCIRLAVATLSKKSSNQ